MKRFLGLSRFSLKEGTDPDPRFTLANERTFLAWIRTSLAMMAAGIAVEALTSSFIPSRLGNIPAILIIVLAACISGFASLRWFAVELALRKRESLPAPLALPLLSVIFVIMALAFAFALI